MPPLGSPVVFHVPKARHMPTLKHDKSEVVGSAYHPEMVDFAALVTRTGEDGTCDLMIFPPNRPPVTVNNVPPEEVEEILEDGGVVLEEDDTEEAAPRKRPRG